MALSGGSSGRTEAVVTCPGEIDDPNFPQQCSKLLNRLQRLLGYEDVNVVKCEPWNSVKITFDLPAEAAEKLSALARTGDDVLREMGILSLQIQGGQIISMTVMSDEELRRSKSKSGAVNSSDSNPITSSLLVNLLQNKDSASTADNNGGPSLQPPADKKRRMQLPPGSNPGATFMIKSEQQHPDCSSAENHRSQPKSASSSSLSPSTNTLKGSMLPPPPPVSASTSPASVGASGTVPSIEKSRQILINPNTGVLESGPSESSSEGETDPGESRTSPAAADKALKLKLKLPNPPSQKPPGSSSGPSEGSKEESGPKLPKLILSMRDKTVKAKFSNKNKVESEDESDDNSCDNTGNSERIKMLIAKSSNPKRTLSLDNAKSATTATAATSSSSSSNSSNSSSSSTVKVNHVIENAAKGNNESIIEGSTKTLQHKSDRLNAWAKSLGVNSRLGNKGAFTNNAINDNHDGDAEDDEKLFSTASSKVEVTSAQSPIKPLKDDDSSIKVEDEITPTAAGGTTTIPTVAYMNGPTSSSTPATSSSSSKGISATGASSSSEPSDMDSTSSGPLPLHHQGEPPDSGTHQQGEDSGIESMDTLSEKSPNQGENPYPNEERLERELAVAAASRAQKASPASSSSASPTSTTSTDSTIAVQSTPTTSVAAVASTSTTQPQQTSKSVTPAVAASAASSSSNSAAANNSSSASEESGSNHTHSQGGINCNGSNDDSSESGAKIVTTSIIIPTSTASHVQVEERSLSTTPELPAIVEQQQLRTSPIMVNGHGPITNGTTVRPAAAHVVPPGAQLVPVKLVSVSAEGAVRLVRVSPVKTTNTSSAASVVAAASASAVPPRTVIIKSTTSAPVISAAATPLPLHLVTSQPLSTATLLKDTNTATKDNTSSTVVLVGEASKANPTTPPNSVQLGPSLSIMPVFDAPPAGHQSGSMSMKDVVDSINKKNSLIEAALNSITTSTTAVEQPLEIDVKKITSMATTPVRPTRQPMPKRSPLQQVDHSFVGGGSLLKPLLATPSKEEVVNNSSPVATTVASAVTVTSTNHVSNDEDASKVGSKRRRRDTDSSTKSDKSDISLLSIESSNSVTVTAVNQSPSPMAVAAKKAKIAVEANKKAAGNLIKARSVKGVLAVSSSTKVKKLEANSVVVKKAATLAGRAENTRAKAKAKVNAVMASLPPSTTITPASAVVSLDQEVSRRSVRQQTPTPGATPVRPPSARQQTPTRTTGPVASAKKPNANSQVKVKANNSSSSSPAESKRLSASPQGTTNSGSSSIATSAVASNAAVSTSVAASEKRMKTRSAKASSSTSDENFETKRRRLKIDS